MVQLARLRARDEPGPVHRTAMQWAGRVEDAAALLEAQGRAVELRDRTRPRRIELATVALALLDELQSVCGWGKRGTCILTGTARVKGGYGMVWCGWRAYKPTCTPDFDRLVVGAGDDGLAVGREGHGAHGVAVRALLLRLQLQGCCRKHRSGQVWG